MTFAALAAAIGLMSLSLGRVVGLECLCKGGMLGGENFLSVGAVECRAHEGVRLLVMSFTIRHQSKYEPNVKSCHSVYFATPGHGGFGFGAQPQVVQRNESQLSASLI
jgi:hypothetical protein